MNTSETYQEKYVRAKARVEEIRSFYNHLILYVVINACIAGFNYYIDGWQFPWFLFPLLGWGIGLLSHGVSVFKLNPLTGKEWQERKIREIMEREENSSLNSRS